jgi:flagellar protein FliL
MVKDAKPAAEDSEVAPPKKSKKLLIIIIAAVVLVLIIGGSAAFFLMHKSANQGDDAEAGAEQSSASTKKAGKEAPPAYVPLDVFTVNLVPEQGDQFLQLSISVEVEDAHTGDKLKVYMPKLRNRVMLLLSDKKASELITREGKQKLAEELREQMNEVMEPSTNGQKAEGPIKEVLFTSFIIQ